MGRGSGLDTQRTCTYSYSMGGVPWGGGLGCAMAMSRGSGVGSHGEGVWAGHTEDMYIQLRHGWGPMRRGAGLCHGHE